MQRIRKQGLGFNAEIIRKDEDRDVILSHVEPDDLVKYGLIPEFVGRLPVIATLHSLSKEMLVKILVEPKNSLVSQYESYFQMEGVKLSFTPEALEKVAELAIEKKTGARGLRAILERALLDIMFELPSMQGVKECIITPETITGEGRPIYVKHRGTRKAL